MLLVLRAAPAQSLCGGWRCQGHRVKWAAQPTVVSVEREPSSTDQQHIDHVQVVQTEEHQPSLHTEQNRRSQCVSDLSGNYILNMRYNICR